MNILPAGELAILVETEDLAAAHRLHAAVRAARLPEVLDVVPGERTVLISVKTPDGLQRLRHHLSALRVSRACLARLRHDQLKSLVEEHDFTVHYDGEDLEEVASLTGLSIGEVIERHTGSRFVVAYLGFAPGFGYLTGLDERLQVPRRSSPRTLVPEGAVAIAGPYGAVYPSSSPGGWRLLGRTEAPLWDLDRDPPALLQPGDLVRFRAAP